MSAVAQGVKSIISQALDKAQRILAKSLNRKSNGTPYEFGVKVGVASTLKGNLILSTRSFPHTPYDGHTLHEQIEQARILSDSTIKDVYVDLGYRGVDNGLTTKTLLSASSTAANASV